MSELTSIKSIKWNSFDPVREEKNYINQIFGSEASFIIFSLRCLQADRRRFT